MKKVAFLVILLALGAALYTQRTLISDYFAKPSSPELPEEISFEEVSEVAEVPEVAEDEVVKPAPSPKDFPKAEELPEPDEEPVMDEDGLPTAINLAVPFTSQAPHANWELPYQEACEEASVLMVHEYYEGTPSGKMNANEADEKILQIVDFQNALFGFYKDTNAVQTAMFAEQLYGYSNIEVIARPSVKRLKTELAAGRPVIIPAAGKMLQNPYFSGDGPNYHMLVIRGYTEDGFITNDPGTRRGEAYIYPFDQLMNAIHDWNDGDVENGAKLAIVIHPEN